MTARVPGHALLPLAFGPSRRTCLLHPRPAIVVLGPRSLCAICLRWVPALMVIGPLPVGPQGLYLHCPPTSLALTWV